MRLALFVATLVATTMVAYFSGIASGSSATPRTCVVGAYVDRPHGLESAAERDVPKAYAGLSSQGSSALPGFQVAGLVSLVIHGTSSPAATGGGWPVNVDRAWRAVAAKCGARVADHAWAVFIAFPACQLPCSYGTVYYAKTRAGWRLLWAA